MSETRFTPGPWKWVVHDHSMASLEGPSGEESHVVSVSPCGSCRKRAQGEQKWEWGRCTTPSLPDAHLIAAAPELYEALAMVREMLRDNPQYEVAARVCADALAKARGEA